MSLAVAVLCAAGVLALLAIAISQLRRRLFLVRQLTFPLAVAALAATLEVLALLRPGFPWLAPVLAWLLLFLGLVTILRLLALFLFDVHLLGQRGLRLPPLLPAVAMALIYLVTAFVTLKLTFPAFDIGPLLATSAVTSLVLGLALQPILGNFFAGLVISVERPFRINDWIRVGDQEGRVVAITWRTTHLRTRDNDNIVIPNGKLAEERVHNFYYPHPLHLARVRVAVHYRHPPYRVRRVLADSAPGVAGVLDKPSPEVYVTAFEDSAVAYELRVWIDDAATSPRITSDLRARIWEDLQRAGMTIPYPTRTVELAPRRTARHAVPRPRPAMTAASPDPGDTASRAPEAATREVTAHEDTAHEAMAYGALAREVTAHGPMAADTTHGMTAGGAADSVESGARGASAPDQMSGGMPAAGDHGKAVATSPRPPVGSAGAADHPTSARLYLVEGPERGQTLELGAGAGTVGRSRSCTLALTDPNASKEHLRIEWENGSWVVTDLGSSFGTRLNGLAVSRAALSPLDRITIGDTTMIFETDDA
jgi:small-conductance mechanosensitive channel